MSVQKHLTQKAQKAIESGAQLTRWIYKDHECYGFLAYISGEEEFTGYGEASLIPFKIKDWGNPDHVARKFEEAGFELVPCA